MSDKYVLDATEKKDWIDALRVKVYHVKTHPQDYRKGYAEKLEKMISAYEGHPDAQIAIVREV